MAIEQPEESSKFKVQCSRLKKNPPASLSAYGQLDSRAVNLCGERIFRGVVFFSGFPAF